MPCFEWNDDDWSELIDQIQTGRCILMLGPDAAGEEVDGGYQPLAEILANELAEKSEIKKLAESLKISIDTSNLAQVSLYYEMKTKRRVRPKVEEFYKDRQNQSSPFHENLAALPFYLAITSTPDDMFYNALINTPKKPVKAHYDFRGNKNDLIAGGTGAAGEPLVFYLYGTIENPNSLVLTENDLLDFLMKIASGNPPLPINILSELRDKEKSFLFLGFGFRHWYLRILLHILQVESKKYASFALEQFDVDRLKNTIYYFSESEYKIQICNAELCSFAEELRHRYERISPVESPKPQFRDASTVFICHTSEDKEYAEKLYTEMKARGFKPWLDKENLRGGVLWNNEIQKTINEIDYFIVLQSEALAKKNIGYVNREIQFALNRQLDFRGLCFIIPVQIDSSPLIEELKHVQSIDLRDPGQIDKLFTLISRDQQIRRR
ncbi:MAG: toll/interleukin-1 receptor domain-containing protein [Syntrophaceae bacterium]